MMTSTPRIAAAAIRFQGKVYSLPPPARHYHVIRQIVTETGTSYVDGEQGFVDNEGRFLNRYEAKAVAEAAGQILDNRAPVLPQLFSENLW